MVRDDLQITVPSYFRCPISLDVMKSPVSLCTGVTYDRRSIQLWLDGGNNTCPATMQVLNSKDLVPNHTLHRLIKVWSASIPTVPPPPAVDSFTHHQLIQQLETQLKTPFCNSSLINQIISRLISFSAEKDGNGKIIATESGQLLPLMVSSLWKVTDIGWLENVFMFCNVLLKNLVKIESSISIIIGNPEFKLSVMKCLRQGKLELKTSMVKFLELMATHLLLEVNSFFTSEDDEIYSELLRLIVNSNWNNEAIDASLCFLIRLLAQRGSRGKMIRAGGVKVLAMALSDGELSPSLTEKVLKLLEMASGCVEGRNEICGDEICVQTIVKKLLKVSNTATELVVTVLWSLCCLFREKRAVAAVAESNGMAKIFVLLQSNCSPAVRQMCGDLLKVVGCNANGKITQISWYDTKTTHIMPF